MPLLAGSRLGNYEILGPLGAGGMGEVYIARDSRLGRRVAVKVVTELLAADPGVRARFEREVRAASALKHPHICAVYDVGREGEADFLVMELLEGETLAARLGRGPLPTESLLRCGGEIADALHRAHTHGITHRDLKPGNVMLTRDGAKLMDFGLARHAPAAGESNAATAETSLTTKGMIVGTTPYVAPELLQGAEADARSDLWALGLVLHEMATGRPAFQGPSQAVLIASILHDEPGPVAPADLDRLVRALLAKNPDDRMQSAHDVRLQLGWIRDRAATAAPVRPARPWYARPAVWGSAAAVGLIAAGAFFAGVRSGGTSDARARPPIHARIPLPAGTRIAGWSSPAVALSADGRTLAFVAATGDNIRRLYIRRLDRDETVQVPGSEEAEGPMFSPDGRWIAFAVGVSTGSRQGQLLKYSTESGLTQKVCDLADYFGGDWLENGNILLIENLAQGLREVPSEGGALTPVAATFRINGKESDRSMRWPQALPGGRKTIAISHGTVVVIDLRTRELVDTGIRTSFARYAPGGTLLYVTSDSLLMAAPFDPVRGKPTGRGVAVLRSLSFTCNGAAVVALSAGGTLVYSTGPVTGNGNEISNIVRMDRRGALRVLPIEPAVMNRCAIAPDGRRLVVSSDGDLWIYDLERGTRFPLPGFDVDGREYPVWAPDGRSVVFRGFRSDASEYDLYRQPPDGAAAPVWLGGTPAEDQPGSITPDGRTLLFGTFDSRVTGRAAVWELPLDGKGTPRQFTSGAGRERFPRVSPDGRLVAYERRLSERSEVYLTTFPEPGASVPVSVDGGASPRWSPDGRELFFASHGRLCAVPIEAGPPPRVGAPRLVGDLADIGWFDMMPDGSGLVGLRVAPGVGSVTELHLVADWAETLARSTHGGAERASGVGP